MACEVAVIRQVSGYVKKRGYILCALCTVYNKRELTWGCRFLLKVRRAFHRKAFFFPLQMMNISMGTLLIFRLLPPFPFCPLPPLDFVSVNLEHIAFTCLFSHSISLHLPFICLSLRDAFPLGHVQGLKKCASSISSPNSRKSGVI